MTNVKEIIKPELLDEKVIQLKNLDKQIAFLKEQQEIIISELKGIMDKHDVEVLTGINEKVTWTESISMLFNQDLFIEENGQDLLNYYKNKQRVNKPFKYKF